MGFDHKELEDVRHAFKEYLLKFFPAPLSEQIVLSIEKKVLRLVELNRWIPSEGRVFNFFWKIVHEDYIYKLRNGTSSRTSIDLSEGTEESYPSDLVSFQNPLVEQVGSSTNCRSYLCTTQKKHCKSNNSKKTKQVPPNTPLVYSSDSSASTVEHGGVRSVKDAFVAALYQRKCIKYPWLHGKDDKIAKTLIKQFGLEKAVVYARNYPHLDTPFVVQNNWDWKFILTNVHNIEALMAEYGDTTYEYYEKLMNMGYRIPPGGKDEPEEDTNF